MMQYDTKRLKQLAEPLLQWYDIHRRHLPWREEVSAYRTWVSEIMLQQTRVSAVLPYFRRFMAAFPTVEDLASADTAQLLKLWEGLGYYSRARNLQKAAQMIVSDCGGQFPDTYDGLLALPGIGDYTAGAILSIAFSQPVPAVDGNVLRLVSRITGCDLNVLDGKSKALFRQWMADAMPKQRCGEFNQALMDLGAMVCLPTGAPLCHECPARDFCRANSDGTQQQLPVRIKKQSRRTEEKTVFLLWRDGEVALRQRPNEGLLAGLWEYPHVEGHLDEPSAAKQLAQWGLAPKEWVKTLRTYHIFTHLRWDMTCYILRVDGIGADDWVWCDRAERNVRAIPSAFEKLKQEMKRWEDTEK